MEEYNMDLLIDFLNFTEMQIEIMKKEKASGKVNQEDFVKRVMIRLERIDRYAKEIKK